MASKAKVTLDRKDPKTAAMLAEGALDHHELMEFSKTFQQEYESLSSRDNSLISKVLKSHLIIEYYINMYLSAAHPGIKIDKLKLRFSQKIELLECDKGNVIIVPGIKELNKIRNAVAHNLHTKIEEGDLQEIKKATTFLTDPVDKIMRKEIGKSYIPKRPKGLDFIEAFADQACSWLAVSTRSIKKRLLKQVTSD